MAKKERKVTIVVSWWWLSFSLSSCWIKHLHLAVHFLSQPCNRCNHTRSLHYRCTHSATFALPFDAPGPTCLHRGSCARLPLKPPHKSTPASSMDAQRPRRHTQPLPATAIHLQLSGRSEIISCWRKANSTR